jgi:hypothetical protein
MTTEVVMLHPQTVGAPRLTSGVPRLNAAEFAPQNH